MCSTFHPDAVIVHLYDLDEVRMLPESLVNFPLNGMSLFVGGPRARDFAHLVRAGLALVQHAELCEQDSMRIRRVVHNPRRCGRPTAAAMRRGWGRRTRTARNVGLAVGHDEKTWNGRTIGLIERRQGSDLFGS